MIAVLILVVIFGGVALIKYVDSAPRGRAALPATAAVAPALPAPVQEKSGTGLETLLLALPEPARARAWALLCRIADGEREGHGDARTAFLLSQTRETYLPDTLRAFLGLTDGARRALGAQGQPPEQLLDEQLALMEDGVREALRHDHAAADRLLTQGRFLRERFGGADGPLSLPESRPSA